MSNPEKSVATTHDSVAVSSEMAPVDPRFVIFGTRVAGVYGARDAFEAHLAAAGFPDAQVDAVRDAAAIQNAFYDIHVGDASRNIEPEQPTSTLRKFVDTLLKREVAVVQDEAETSTNLPQGVVVFPEMRQYTSTGGGMTIPSPREYIQELCDEHGVPVIFMEDLQNEAELATAVSRLALESDQVTQE